jgi:hypothetical protein
MKPQRTIQCPLCLAYMQGDFQSMAALPIHLKASHPDTEMELALKLNDPETCPASSQLVHTVPSEKI